ncbi:MAG TPA: hypothetical protein VF928_11930 [Usitatibacteraceae bacterium]
MATANAGRLLSDFPIDSIRADINIESGRAIFRNKFEYPIQQLCIAKGNST